MTLTAPGCGMGPVLVQDVEDRLKRVPFVDNSIGELSFRSTLESRPNE